MPEKAKRRLKNLQVEYISLVDAGANKREVVFKRSLSTAADADKVTMQFNIKKVDEEKRLVYGIVYAPDEIDAHGDTMTASEIEKAAHAFLAAGKTNRVDKQHDGNPDKGFIVESSILKGQHEFFPGEQAGAWYVAIKVADDDVWEEVKKGEIGGISLEGICETEALEKGAAEVAKEFFAHIGKFMRGVNESPEETEDELPAFGSFAAALKYYQDHPGIQKDFNSALDGRQIPVAVQALEASNWSIIHNEFVDDKKMALKTNAEQFLTHLESLQVSKSKPETSDKLMATEEEKKKAAEEASKAAGKKEEPAEKQAAGESGQEEIEKLRKQNEELTARLEKLEKAASGEQGLHGREEEESGKTKTAKGITWVPEK